MDISTNVRLLSRCMDEIEAVKLFAKCGFTSLDLSMDDMWDVNCKKLKPDYKEYAKELKTVADGCGIVFNQSHAPFHSSFLNNEEKTAYAYDIIKRAMEFSALVGVPNIVVHPKQHLNYPEFKDELRDMNLEFYSSLIPLCKEYNINIMVENMWSKNSAGNIVRSTCSSAEEFREYVDMVGSPYIKSCLDIGHAYLTKENIPDMIDTLGTTLAGLHVHDVAMDNDLHTFPFFADINNWDEIMKALSRVDYKGDLTFEIKPSGDIPQSILSDYIKLLHSVGVALRDKFYSFK